MNERQDRAERCTVRDGPHLSTLLCVLGKQTFLNKDNTPHIRSTRVRILTHESQVFRRQPGDTDRGVRTTERFTWQPAGSRTGNIKLRELERR